MKKSAISQPVHPHHRRKRLSSLRANPPPESANVRAERRLLHPLCEKDKRKWLSVGTDLSIANGVRGQKDQELLLLSKEASAQPELAPAAPTKHYRKDT